VYSCSFTEERDLSTFCRAVTRAESDLQDGAGNIRNKKSPSSAKASTRNSVKGKQFSPKEDKLLVSLKTQGLSWSDIAKHFPRRTEGSLQVRYCTKLNPWKFGSGQKRPGRARSVTSSATSALDSDLGSCSAECAAPPSQRYGPPRSRRAVDRYSPA
jgi:hypothetical protein